MGYYKQGDKVSWRGLNREYTGEVVGIDRTFAVVRVDGSGGLVLLQNEPIKSKRR